MLDLRTKAEKLRALIKKRMISYREKADNAPTEELRKEWCDIIFVLNEIDLIVYGMELDMDKPRHSCTDCEHLFKVNREPVYAKCTLTDYTFLLWGENTDNHCCEHHEEVNHNVTMECMYKPK